MTIAEAIVKYGARAVLRYREVAGIPQDNRMPEIFLGGVIACGLHDDLKLNAHVERPYIVIARELGIPVTAELLSSMDGLRADVAVYDKEKPIAVIELKLFDDGKQASSIAWDIDKMGKLAALGTIEAYVGVMFTDVASGQSCSDRLLNLQKTLGCQFNVVGKKQWSIHRNWEWFFASAQLFANAKT